MNLPTSHLKPGLYLVPTPIGNLKDITLRAIEILKAVNVIACEDMRISSKLLSHYDIKTRLLSYHEHNAEKMRPRILKTIAEGGSVALISDAGTPLISDPGFKLVRTVHENGLYLTSLPGPSSVSTALTLSGFPTDHFVFAGFVKDGDFKTLSRIPYTLIFFSTANKLLRDLNSMQAIFTHRDVAITREISKLFEEVKRGSFSEIMEHYGNHPPKGEIVVILSPPTMPFEINWEEIYKKIRQLKDTIKAKDLCEMLAKEHGVQKREVYRCILSLKSKTSKPQQQPLETITKT